VSAREGWNIHGWWIGDPASQPKDGRPAKLRCGGPRVCATCGPTAVSYPTGGDFPATSCKFCHEPIIWAETLPNPRARTARAREETKLVPMDAEPFDSVYVLTKNPGGRPRLGEMGRNQAAGYRGTGGKTYQRHVKTCAKVHLWPKGAFIPKQRGSA
jgi:hypothetical protein